MTVRAAFDFPERPPNRARRLRGQFRRAAEAQLRADRPDQVPAVLAAAEAAARSGRWVLGAVAYSGAWDPDQRVLPDPGTPAALFEVHAGDPEPWTPPTDPFPALEWRLEEELAGGRSAASAIGSVLDRIAAGDCYQVNLTTRARATADAGTLYPLFGALARAQPGGYLFYSAAAGVASVSPELFFDWEAPALVTQPMKGTAPAWADPAALVQSPKERAENLMIVDLLRNDLGRVCRPGTVRTERLFELHRLPTVWQLTSTVSGETRPGTSLADVFDALFPCGSVTGAPKLASMGIIADLEAESRGWYCGALGLLRPGGRATFSVAIRTVTAAQGELLCGVGSGIVADSRPLAEIEEWSAKTAFLGGVPLRGLETILLEQGRLHRLERHLDRLARTCTALGLELDPGQARDALAAAAAAHATGRHRVRLVAGGGPPQVEVSAAPAPGLPVALRLAGQPLAADPRLIHNKTTHREHYRRLLAAAGPGVTDVICHNAEGELTECTMGNLAVRLDGQWFTPPESAGLLPGVLRAELLEQGRLQERTLLLADLERAEELAFINSLRGWCPARLESRAAAGAQGGRPDVPVRAAGG